MSTVATGRVESIPADSYHADPCDTPSLSASIAHLLCTSSPRHAWTAHPRLNPVYERAHDEKFDVGNVCHAIILEGRNIVHVVDASDWRTNAAKDERDAARAAGKIPLLCDQMADVELMVAAVWKQLAEHQADPPPFVDGKPEQTIVFDVDGVTCRALIDWLHDDRLTIDDLKTTGRSADPDAWKRSSLFVLGRDIQAAFHIKAVEAVTGITPEFRWVVAETSSPFALSVIAPSAAVLTLGWKKVEYAIGVWRRCLENDEWSGYPREVAYADLPEYEEAKWLAKEERELLV